LSEEVAPTHEDAVGDELDMAFREIISCGFPKEPDNVSSAKLELVSRPSSKESIIPEPEDLLGEITSSAVKGGEKASCPEFDGQRQTSPRRYDSLLYRKRTFRTVK
jgi:hypothetical protein